MDKKLTIGIGTYGQTRNYISRTLKSIIALLKKYRYTNKTTIFVYNDDSIYSLDYMTALKFQQKYPNLIVCRDNGQNLGIAKTYQKMCFECETPYFLQFDSDDIIGDFNIKQQIQLLDNNKQYSGSYGIKIIFNQNGEKIAFFGQQYSLTRNRITINNNSLLLRVEDCKNTNMYFPQYYTNEKSFVAALDVVMWVGMILKKPFYFDNTVRAYGLDWIDGNHIKHGDKYNVQFAQMNEMLTKKYGIFSDDWTIYEKQLYYQLFAEYLNKQQKAQYWDRIGEDRFNDPEIFLAYLNYLCSQQQHEKIIANLYLGLLKNDKLKTMVASVIATSNLIGCYKWQFIQYFNNQIAKIQPYQNEQWFKKFIKIR